MMRTVGFAVLLVAAACARPADQPAPAQPAASPPAAASGNALVSGRAPRGAVVTLEPLPPREFPLPPGPVIMDQYAKAFVPELLIARVGQVVEFRNSEDTIHNVIVIKQPTGRSIFDISRPPFEAYHHTFTEPGMYAVSCDIHPGMRAALFVTPTPHATVVDASGTFTLAEVMPGAYKLLISGSGQDSERTIQVTPPRTDVAVPGA